MPRPVVPIFWLFSLAASSSLWNGSTRWARSETKMRPVGVDPALGELVELAEEGLGLEHDAVADDAGDAAVQDARRNLAQDEVRVADDDRMAGVGAALVAHDQVGPLGEDVDELALALVPPLRPDDHHAGGLRVEHVGSPACPTKRSPSRGSRILGQTYARTSQQSIRRECPSDPYRGLERKASAVSRGRVDRAERAPGEPADRERGHARAARTAGCRSGCPTGSRRSRRGGPTPPAAEPPGARARRRARRGSRRRARPPDRWCRG